MTHRIVPSRRQVLASGLATGLTAAGFAPSAFAQSGAGPVLRVGHQKGWLSILKGRGTLEKRLAPLGVTREMFPHIIRGALKDHSHRTNPRVASETDYEAMLEASM
eukprot:gene2644-3428_t